MSSSYETNKIKQNRLHVVLHHDMYFSNNEASAIRSFIFT